MLRKNKKPKAPLHFTYEAEKKAGGQIKGHIEAACQKEAKRQLQTQGYFRIKLKLVRKPISSYLKQSTIKAGDICQFARQMATMMSSGIPLIQSFDIVAGGLENEKMKTLVQNIQRDVEGGLSLSETLAHYPKYFDPLFCSLIAAGEASGSLEAMLDRVATYKEKTESLKRKIKKALFYPAAVVAIAVIVTMILLIFVVPQFEDLFASFGADLPTFTQFVIHLSDLIQAYWWLCFAAMAGAGYLFRYLYRTQQRFRDLNDKLILRLPVIGKIIRKAILARYARTLSTTFAAGVPLVEALDSVAEATNNVIYRQAVHHIKEEVSIGNQMQSAMRVTHVFPPMMVQLIAIGEEAGSLDAMLSKVADIYEEEVDLAVDGLSSLLEPLIMAILGVLVGGLVIAMYLPIFQMGAVI